MASPSFNLNELISLRADLSDIYQARQRHNPGSPMTISCQSGRIYSYCNVVSVDHIDGHPRTWVETAELSHTFPVACDLCEGHFMHTYTQIVSLNSESQYQVKIFDELFHKVLDHPDSVEAQRVLSLLQIHNVFFK